MYCYGENILDKCHLGNLFLHLRLQLYWLMITWLIYESGVTYSKQPGGYGIIAPKRPLSQRPGIEESAMKRKLSAPGRKILLFSAIYFVSYITRNSYSVSLAAMLQETGLGQSMLS